MFRRCLAFFASLSTFAALSCGCGVEQQACPDILVFAFSITVADASTGDRICDATVTATNERGQSSKLTALTGGECVYQGSVSSAGIYTIRAEKAGFVTGTASNLRIDLNECGNPTTTHQRTIALTR
jgi:hypothetical protein